MIEPSSIEENKISTEKEVSMKSSDVEQNAPSQKKKTSRKKKSKKDYPPIAKIKTKAKSRAKIKSGSKASGKKKVTKTAEVNKNSEADNELQKLLEDENVGSINDNILNESVNDNKGEVMEAIGNQNESENIEQDKVLDVVRHHNESPIEKIKAKAKSTTKIKSGSKASGKNKGTETAVVNKSSESDNELQKLLKDENVGTSDNILNASENDNNGEVMDAVGNQNESETIEQDEVLDAVRHHNESQNIVYDEIIYVVRNQNESENIEQDEIIDVVRNQNESENLKQDEIIDVVRNQNESENLKQDEIIDVARNQNESDNIEQDVVMDTVRNHNESDNCSIIKKTELSMESAKSNGYNGSINESKEIKASSDQEEELDTCGNNLSKKRKSSSKPKSKKKSNKKVSSKSKSKQTSRKSGTIKTLSPQYKVNENDDISCRICEQKLNNDLKFYSREPLNGFEEELAIIDSRLLLFSGDEENVSQEDTRAYNKLTSFSVYCKNGHLCSFDSGLIERDIEIYFSGYIKPIYSDNTSIDDGVPGKDFGPIAEWWTTGFDIGEQPTIAFSTEIGDYILMSPSEEYAPFMQSVVVKILISKIVIEYLVYEPNATYEDLLHKLQNTGLPHNTLPRMTEDVLLQHAPFICDQVMSFDEKAKLNEPLLLVAPCIRRLIDLAGISIEGDSVAQSRRQRRYQERHARSDYREELLRRAAENRGELSSSGQLIDGLLPPDRGETRRTRATSRCGDCERCQRPGCDECEACARRRHDECPQRRCFYREIQEAKDEDAKDLVDLSRLKAESSIAAYRERVKTFSRFSASLDWLGKPIAIEEDGSAYYGAAKLGEEYVGPGDFVLVRSVEPSVPAQVVRLAYMWQDGAGLALFHANYYWWARDTVLGELGNERELVSIDRCATSMALSCVTGRIDVVERRVPASWVKTECSTDQEEGEASQYFCEKSYEPSSGRFQDLPSCEEAFSAPAHRVCRNCEGQHRRNERNEPRVLDKLEGDAGKTIYRAVVYRDEKYTAGSFVYLKPKSLYFQYPMLVNPYGSLPNAKSVGNISKKVDEEKYPEYWRKSKDEIDLKFDMSAPFDIGYINEIFITDKLYIKVQKLYRPENTHRNETLNKQFDINMLYWSDEVCLVAFSYVVGKCYVLHGKDLNMNVEEWSSLGPDRFYFTQMYQNKKFSHVDRKEYGCKKSALQTPKDYPKVDKLNTLDIFAGCGGLSLGLRQAGVARSCWAIEPDKAAASTYKLNSPNTAVFIEDCNVILNNILKGEFEMDGQSLPQRDEVDLLCASLPCKSYRDMTDVSIFKNSSIATFLSYCDYYKPSLFVLEADERLIKRSTVLKLTVACLVGIGYQVSFDLMQVGCYGAPQNRRRSVLLGAAPGQALPKYPQRLHVFPKSLCQLGIVIDNKRYTQETFWVESAPYRAMTVRDALSDLPTIEAGKNMEVVNYDDMPTSYFAKMMRLGMVAPTVFNHTSKDFGPLVQSRIMQIPMTIGSDWRNLPNIEVQLKDGSFTKKLMYNYDDILAGKSSRGVCACAAGKKCEPRDRQTGSLIPWHLVHSAERHQHWRGLYSRLQWDGFFEGALTNPEPLGTQGPVLHPTQPRAVSVRECMRAQGFPDDFALPQELGIHERYRQIGISASPLLGRALGCEIARGLEATSARNPLRRSHFFDTYFS